MKRLGVAPMTALRAAFVALLAGLLFGSGAYMVIARVEENDAFCASCHSEPETTYYGRTRASAAVDLASAHAHGYAAAPATRCIDCHSGAGVSGRLGAMALGAHDAWRWVLGTARQPAITTLPLADENCLKCHTDTPNQTAFDQHFHRTLARWQAASPSAGRCVSCHTSHTTDGNATIGFLQQQRMRAVCDQCHIDLGVDR